jgi:formylglycine-generating enzyme required for sulfatase activity
MRAAFAALVVALLCSGGQADDQRPWQAPGTLVGEQIFGPDGGALVWVPAGEFMMGGAQPAGWDTDHQTEHPVAIPKGLWIGRCEVTNEQYARFLNEIGAHQDAADPCPLLDVGSEYSDILLRDEVFVPREGRELHPVMMVSWYGAQRYCEHYGLRLPTEAEWEYAARGPEGRAYPWGDSWDGSRCVDYHHAGKGLVKTKPVGSLRHGASWSWALDLAGNVAEWCGDWYAADYYESSPREDPRGPETGDTKCVRGGSWDPYLSNVQLRCVNRLGLDPRNCLPTVGFRVACTPDG